MQRPALEVATTALRWTACERPGSKQQQQTHSRLPSLPTQPWRNAHRTSQDSMTDPSSNTCQWAPGSAAVQRRNADWCQHRIEPGAQQDQAQHCGGVAEGTRERRLKNDQCQQPRCTAQPRDLGPRQVIGSPHLPIPLPRDLMICDVKKPMRHRQDRPWQAQALAVSLL